MEFKNKNKMKKRDQKASDKQDHAERKHVMKVVKKDLLNA